MTTGRTAFDRALDQLGRSIVSGELPADHGDTIEGLTARTGASRSVVREVSRVLGSLGMLSAGRRVGLRVLAPEHWDVLDPLVIRWRLDGPDPQKQVDELRALRHAVEPAAAAAAARTVQCGGVSTQALTLAVAALRRAGEDPDPAGFLQADLALHAAVLDFSANSMFIRLRAVVDEGLRVRALRERPDLPPNTHDLDLHVQVASAILAGDEQGAAHAMREIVERTSSAHP